jgi:hypothetical protein
LIIVVHETTFVAGISRNIRSASSGSPHLRYMSTMELPVDTSVPAGLLTA